MLWKWVSVLGTTGTHSVFREHECCLSVRTSLEMIAETVKGKILMNFRYFSSDKVINQGENFRDKINYSYKGEKICFLQSLNKSN